MERVPQKSRLRILDTASTWNRSLYVCFHFGEHNINSFNPSNWQSPCSSWPLFFRWQTSNVWGLHWRRWISFQAGRPHWDLCSGPCVTSNERTFQRCCEWQKYLESCTLVAQNSTWSIYLISTASGCAKKSVHWRNITSPEFRLWVQLDISSTRIFMNFYNCINKKTWAEDSEARKVERTVELLLGSSQETLLLSLDFRYNIIAIQ